jgi:hypothetical protein
MISSSRRPRAPFLHCLPAVLAFLALTACESDHAGRGDRDADNGVPAPDKAQPEMEARGTFFAGQIQVDVLLNRAGFAGRGKDTGSGDALGGGSGIKSGGGRGHRGEPGASSMAAGGGDDQASPVIHPSNLPAVRLHLRFVNLGSSPVEIEVPDFNSDLGDFVVEPEKIPLPPNESVEAEPMTSQLGVSSDAIPIAVSLWMKGPSGLNQTEKQVLVMRPVAAPSHPPAPTS